MAKRKIGEVESEIPIKVSEINTDYCDICKQPLNEVFKFKGSPKDSVPEFITTTDKSLSVTPNENLNQNEKQVYKLTDFNVYDMHRHLCRFDSGLIEAGESLLASGYVKNISDEDPSRNNGTATNTIGPLEQWFIAGFDGGKEGLVGFSTECAEYYLVEPSLEYRPVMKWVEEKKRVIKLVLEFLLHKLWETPSYEDLLQWCEIHSESEITEETLLNHAQFICNQVMNYDAAGDSNDDILITTPCMRTLAAKANIELNSANLRIFKTKGRPLGSRAASTCLVRDVFQIYFKDEIDKKGKYKSPRRDRCGVCESCQTPDCGHCAHCHNMPKFGGASSKQICQMRRALPIKPTSNFLLFVHLSICLSIRLRMWPHSCENANVVKDLCSNFSTQDSDITPPFASTIKNGRLPSLSRRMQHIVEWSSKQIAEHAGRIYYNTARVDEIKVKSLDYVMLRASQPNQPLLIAQIIYMWQEGVKKMVHARLFRRGTDTILGETSNPRELFMVNVCEDHPLGSIVRKAKVKQNKIPNDWASRGGSDRMQPHLEDNGEKFFYSKFYDSTSGKFEDIGEKDQSPNVEPPYPSCSSCSYLAKEERLKVPVLQEDGSIQWSGDIYKIGTAVFLRRRVNVLKRNRYAYQFEEQQMVNNMMYPELYRKAADYQNGSNVDTPDPFTIGLIEKIGINYKTGIRITIRKFYRPEDTLGGVFNSYNQDLNLVYWTTDVYEAPFAAVTGKCYLAYGPALDKTPREWTEQGPYRFYFTEAYDKSFNEYRELPEEAKCIGINRKQGKGKGKSKSAAVVYELPPEWEKTDQPLSCLDLFAGCGGLSDGLRQSGVAEIKWAIEKEPAAAHAFKLNNPDSMVYTADCNELLHKTMANEEYHGRKLPQKGEVDMIVGGPPCQGFSGMNRFNTGEDSSFNNSLIVSFLSYCDYYRPKYVVLENVRSFFWFRHSIVFKLTVCCLLAMGYQVTFGVLQAGNYGVAQSRRRLFIIAAAPGYMLPKFPEPQNSFNANACKLGVTVGNIRCHSGAKWWASAPYRTLTVRDAIADLPNIESGCNRVNMPYDNEAVSHFQRMMHADASTRISDHICKELTPIAQSRISHIPLNDGSDWRDLPNIVVQLSDGTSTTLLKYRYRSRKQRRGPLRGVCSCSMGRSCNPAHHQTNTLIPWSLPHTADRNNNWAGVYGRLQWDGFFSTTVTNPDPVGKQGRVLHPDQHRVVSVRECARSQGFPDHYQFYGSISNKYRQIGNAVPPPLAVALGREIQKALVFKKNEP